MYVAEVVDDADGTRTTRVIRTREVASRLGEPSTIVADESLVREGDPALSVGSDGLIYLAMPGDPAAADPTLQQGRLLRFTPDGSAAGTAGAGSATLAEIAAESDSPWRGIRRNACGLPPQENQQPPPSLDSTRFRQPDGRGNQLPCR